MKANEFLGRPISYWIALDNNAKQLNLESLVVENAKLTAAIKTALLVWENDPRHPGGGIADTLSQALKTNHDNK